MNDCQCVLWPWDNCFECVYFIRYYKMRSLVAVKLHLISYLTKLLRESQLDGMDTMESLEIRNRIIHVSNQISCLQYGIGFLVDNKGRFL